MSRGRAWLVIALCGERLHRGEFDVPLLGATLPEKRARFVIRAAPSRRKGHTVDTRCCGKKRLPTRQRRCQRERRKVRRQAMIPMLMEPATLAPRQQVLPQDSRSFTVQ